MKSPGLLEPNHRILVIDDNQAIHDDLRKILLGEVDTQEHLQDDEAFLFGMEAVPITKFEIDSAYQGQEGLAKLEQSLAEGRPYALAFVDVRMPPGWDGVETITRLWQVYPNLQVVVCTAYSDYSWNDIQRRLGQSENLLILKKPFDNIEVIQLAHALTRKWLVSGQAQAQLEDLDLMVAQRTAELQAANQRIKQEFEEKAAAEVAFRTVFESSPIGIALADLNGCYVDVNNSTTARALAVLMQKIATGHAVSAKADAEMVEILKRQKFHDAIPAGLPDSTPVAHKTGNITKIHHDAAIVYGPRPYVLVVLVRGIQEQKESGALIAAISREVWNEFSSSAGGSAGRRYGVGLDLPDGNGTFRLSQDFPGAVEFRRIALAEGLAPGPNGGNNAREWWVVPKRERRRTGRLTSN